ncbi:hypothetical protein HA402_007038 [Bradysia odoriphaga]|nr:hypothetical protein HA402_007038 [Bradysia odoriphaga]
MEKGVNIPLEPVQNYLRLQHLLNYIALPLLQSIFVDKWKSHYQSEWKNSKEQGMEFINNIGSALFKDARKIQKNLLKTGDIQKWDVPLMIEALKCFNKTTKTKSELGSKEQLKGFNKLVEVRNQLSHHRGLEIDNTLFEELWNSASESLIALGITRDDLDKAKIVSVRENERSISRANELKEEGNLLVKNGKFSLAVEKYTNAISQPGLPSKELAILHSNRSMAHLKLGNYYKAKDDAMGTTLLNPNWWRGFGRLGHVYLSVDKYTQALENFEKAIELDPDCKLQNERDHCRHMIEKINRDEHMDPMYHVSTFEQLSTKMMDKNKISPLATNTMNMMKDRINLTSLPSGMCAEGHKYQHGMGVTQDYQIAAQWFAKAAAEGSAEGLYNLAILTKEGKGVKIDVAESVRLLKLAASQDICVDMFGIKMPNIGVKEAEHCLGLSYHDGIGVPQDFHKALEWYTRAIKHGSGVSANNIGFMYNNGNGVSQDTQIAINYHKLGAAMKVVRAMENVAETYFRLFDKENAKKWFQYAISKGSLSLQSKRQAFFALVGNELDAPIEEDIFELELMEEVKTGPLGHLIDKDIASSPEDLMWKMFKSLKPSNECLATSTSRSLLGLEDPYRIEIIKNHRTALRLQRNKSLKCEKGDANLLPRPVVDLFTLKPIFFADMDPKKDHIYEKFAIKLTFIEDAITGRPSICQIAEDEKGDAQRVFIYNFPQNDETQNKIGFGCKVTIVNPYFRLAKDGKPMIRVDDISLMFLHSSASNKNRCRYCGNECQLTVPCRQCKRSYYCSKICLKKDSMELDHKDVCLKRL